MGEARQLRARAGSVETMQNYCSEHLVHTATYLQRREAAKETSLRYLLQGRGWPVQIPSQYHLVPLFLQLMISLLPNHLLDKLVCARKLTPFGRECPAPITTLPPLSLLHPQVCPEPSSALDASLNTAGRLAACQITPPCHR